MTSENSARFVVPQTTGEWNSTSIGRGVDTDRFTFEYSTPTTLDEPGRAGRIAAVAVIALVVLGVGGFALWKTMGGQCSGGGLAAGSDVSTASPDGTNASAGSAGTDGAPSSCSLVATEEVAAVLGGEGWTVLDVGTNVARAVRRGRWCAVVTPWSTSRPPLRARALTTVRTATCPRPSCLGPARHSVRSCTDVAADGPGRQSVRWAGERVAAECSIDCRG